MSCLPTPHGITQGESKEETLSQSHQNEQDLTVTKQDSNICQTHQNLESAEVDVASQPSDTRPSVWQTGSSSAATSKENPAGQIVENAHIGLTEPSSSLEKADQTSYKNVDHEHSINFGGLHEGHAFSQAPDTGSDFFADSNLYNSAQTAVSPPGNGMSLKNNALDSESKPKEPHTSRVANETFESFEENFADFSKQQLPEQGTGAAVVVSMDLDGWQRFDLEGKEGNVAFGCDQAINRKLLRKGELWEQLLEEGSEDGETLHGTSISQVETETGIDNALYGGNQFWLASPGNPFKEGLDRLSNFSEADQCTAGEFIAKSPPPESFEPNMGLPFKESPFQTDYTSKNCLQDKLVEGKGSQSNGLYEHGSNRPAKPRFPFFSDLRRPSSGSKDPCFASFLDPIPAFQAGNHVQGIENGEEKWEANFDTTGFPAQEGPRSLSLPREAGTTQGQRQKQSFSFFSREATARSQSKPSGISSPKRSSIVKKVVSKVRTKPAGEVQYAVRKGKSSSSMDKEPKRRVWRCCICCTHES